MWRSEKNFVASILLVPGIEPMSLCLCGSVFIYSLGHLAGPDWGFAVHFSSLLMLNILNVPVSQLCVF